MAQMLTVHQITRLLGPRVPAWDVRFPVQRLSIRAVQWARGWMGSALGQVSTMWF